MSIITLGHYQFMRTDHLLLHVCTCLSILETDFIIANAERNTVELFDFKSKKWVSKVEWSYPFHDGKG